ncbi:iron-containing alcohol dehydrogenase [Infirmifilum lucidum]|uniref:Glycerol-1-phosphate dehydrogenase [NAD(P)+] n=1 Tax=Infirmifilum lucidum TaxID=2776706 RepID=A0A7L9FGD4_9CREN|nr:iron-containing alcohol dehydrogenase [Infirmifilum lucidum]QOJ78767.1 iron-containing alcohol dehydrogenase [Infirmifilum lucidum]
MKFRLPWIVSMGEGAFESLPEALHDVGCSSALVVTDSTVKKLFGWRIEGLLGGNSIRVGFVEVATNHQPTLDKLHVEIPWGDFGCVLGMGGGRPVDVGKYLAYKSSKPFVSVPTSISHDGFASPIVALKDDGGNPLSLFTAPPRAVIVDLEVVSKAPRRLLASGVGDIVAKVTSVADARLAIRERGEDIPESSLRLAESAASMVLENIEEVSRWSTRGLRVLAEAGLMAGMAMSVAGSSRPCSGAEHLFSHAVDKLYPERGGLHGEQVGVGSIVSAYLHGIDWRRLRDALKRVGAPTSVREIGLSVEEAARALLEAPRLRQRYTILHKLNLSEREAREAITATVGSE